ncbi:hypothetical protein F5Y17DRAFT_456692 [Xylariaceae sp. FL0594]|nr:hypothetical protein F5Y17DRAFT_456692 [Xylariaceae sp. FL0594]
MDTHPAPIPVPGSNNADGGGGPLPPPPVMGMTQKEYEAAFTYLDHSNFAREAEEFEAEASHHRLIFPILPWYKRPEFWALIIGSLSLVHGLFVQWAWPRLQEELSRHKGFPGHEHGNNRTAATASITSSTTTTTTTEKWDDGGLLAACRTV